VEEKLQNKCARSFRLLIIVGILWIIAFPYIAQDVFTSENALNGSSLESVFMTNPHLTQTFTNIKAEVEALPSIDQDGGKALQKFVTRHMAKRYETHQ
jgi:hypothetical protein